MGVEVIVGNKFLLADCFSVVSFFVFSIFVVVVSIRFFIYLYTDFSFIGVGYVF